MMKESKTSFGSRILSLLLVVLMLVLMLPVQSFPAYAETEGEGTEPQPQPQPFTVTAKGGLVYTGAAINAEDAVSVENVPEGAVLDYSVTDPAGAEIKNVGIYTVTVTASVDGAMVASASAAVEVKAAAPASFAFNNYADNGSTTEKKSLDTAVGYDFSVNVYPEMAVAYSVSPAEGATIDANGQLIVSKHGTYTVTVSVGGNYSAVISHTIAVEKLDSPIKFDGSGPASAVPVTAADMVLSEKTAASDTQTVGYSLEGAPAGIAVDAATGKLTVSDYSALLAELIAGDKTFTVKAAAAENDTYAAGEASYQLTLTLPAIIGGWKIITPNYDAAAWYQSVAIASEAENGKLSYDGTVYEDELVVNFVEEKPVYVMDAAGVVSKSKVHITNIDIVSPVAGDASYTFAGKEIYLGFKVTDEHFDRVEWVATGKAGGADFTKNGSVSAAELSVDSVLDTADAAIESLTIVCNAYDLAGNKTEFAPAFNNSVVVIKSIAITPAEGSFIKGENGKADVNVEISVSANAMPGAGDFTLKIDNEEKAVSWNGSGENYVGTVALTDVADGEHVVSYSGKGLAGEQKFTVDGTLPVIAAPVLKDSDIYYKTGDVINFEYQITETNPDVLEMVLYYGTEVVSSSVPVVGDSQKAYFTVDSSYADGDYKIVVKCVDKAGNEATGEVALIVDKTVPTYTHDIVDVYQEASAEIKFELTDENIKADSLPKASYKDADGNSKTVEGAIAGNTITLILPEEAIYTVEFAPVDLAGNAGEVLNKTVTVDKTAPHLVSVKFDVEFIKNVVDNLLLGFLPDKVDMTVTAEDRVSGVDTISYKFTAEGIAEQNTAAAPAADNVKATNGSITIEDIPASLRGYFSFRFKDVATNESEWINERFYVVKDKVTDPNKAGNNWTDAEATDPDAEEKIFGVVIDGTAPVLEVTRNTPVNTVDDVHYFTGKISYALSVEEANFFKDIVSANVNGTEQALNWNGSGISYTSAFEVDGDGEYVVGVSAADYSGNASQYSHLENVTIDSQIAAPTITINGADGDGMAYNGDVSIQVSFEDEHYDSYKIQMSRTTLGKKGVDVTDLFVTGNVAETETGATGVFDDFGQSRDNDGIYTLTVSYTDKALNTASRTITFTLNRFGSVYEYSADLEDLIADGGQIVTSVDGDLVINEYNADKLEPSSVKLEITRDGRPVDGVIYDINPDPAAAAIGSEGWYKYTYTISKENFAADGIYKVSVSSKDASGNASDNSAQPISFLVDGTAPEITSVSGLEEAIVNAGEHDVGYTVFDAMGLSSIKIYVDGELYEEITEFSDPSNYDSVIKLVEMNTAQNVRIVVTDIAGNVSDTSADDFDSAYVMVDGVLVTTNAFVRWYANKPLFWGSIGGGVAVFAVAIFLIARKKAKADASA